MFIKNKLKVSLLAVLLGMLLIPSGVLASTVGDSKTQEVKIEIEGGEFSINIPTVANFKNYSLNNLDQPAKTGFNGAFNIQDSRGSHEGYRVDVKASQLAKADGYKLPTGSLSLSSVSKVSAVNSNAVPPKAKFTGNLIVDAGTITVLEATKGTGMGGFSFTFPTDALSLNLNYGTVQQGLYSTTLTWSLVTAP